MSVLKSLRVLARYNVLTPIAILAVAAMPSVAWAATVGPGANSGSITLANNEDLTNSGTITQDAGNTAVFAGANAGTILNNAGGIIQTSIAGFNAAIFVAGDTVALTNSGTIRGIASAQAPTVVFGTTTAQHIGSFTNNLGGTIAGLSTDSNAAAVYIVGTIDTFSNAGDISSLTNGGEAVIFETTVGTFANSSTGRITDASTGALFRGAVTTFSNAGQITGTSDKGVQFDSTLGTFTNLTGGMITGQKGVRFGAAVTTFGNAGQITSTNGPAVDFIGNVGTFTNESTGRIVSANGRAVSVGGNIDAFTNKGFVQGDDNASVVRFEGTVGTFLNSGTIENTGNNVGVYFGLTAGTFTNSGSITSLVQAVQADRLVSTFTNSGTIKGGTSYNDAVSLGGGVSNFLNDTGGLIQNGLAGTTDGGKAVKVNVEIGGNGAAVTSFINKGKILGGTADMPNHQAPTIGFDSPGNAAAQVAYFFNSGTISGPGTGVDIGGDATHGGFGTFINAVGGTITSTQQSAINSGGLVGTFSNAGTISGAGGNAINFQRGVNSFTNELGGLIINTNAGSDGGGAVGFQTDTGTGGPVLSFINKGTLTGSLSSDQNHQGSTVGFFRDANSASLLGYFFNSGAISGPGTGVSLDGGVTTFINASGGSITSTMNNGVSSDGPVNSFTNSSGASILSNVRQAASFNKTVTGFTNGGTITGASWQAIEFSGGVTTFVNELGGIIKNTDATTDSPPDLGGTAVQINTRALNGSVTNSFINRGSIIGAANAAAPTVAFYGYGGPGQQVVFFGNEGTISGVGTGVYFTEGVASMLNSGSIISTGDNAAAIVADASSVASSSSITNSGILKGKTTAVAYGSGNDKLTILTGSQIFGDLRFNGGTDTLNFAGFMGNTVLDVKSLDTLVAGSRSFFDLRDGNGDGKVAIIDVSGLGNSVIGQNDLDLGLAMLEMIHANAQDNDAGQPAEPLQFAPTPAKTSALAAVDTAVLTELDTVKHMGVTVWGGFIGGGSNRTLPIDQASLYGGLVMGTHARLNETFKLGGTAGYVVTNTSTQAGQQTLASQTGVVGVYSNISLGGVADIDLALLGGLSSHTSKRQVIANNQVQTATGLFTSYFFAPSAALSVPVLSGDAGTILFKTSATYVGGLTSAYTETGSAMNLAVGSQTISVFDARAGLEGRHGFDLDSGTTAELVAKAGVFAQINNGSASVPVTTLGQTINVATPGSSAYGVYGGVGVDAQLTESLKLTISTDGSFRTDGLNTISIKGGLAGTF